MKVTNARYWVIQEKNEAVASFRIGLHAQYKHKLPQSTKL